jgi:cytochrome c-type biogenesis protein
MELGLSLLAGVLSTLSPCVLPLLPVVLGTAVSEHKWGPVALTAGLTISFVAIGMFIALIGFSIGLDDTFFRNVSASLLIVMGAVLAMPKLQAKFAIAAGPVGNWTEQRFGGFSQRGLGGQFGVGLLLGAVWLPCVGPTLGAASLLAAQGQDLVRVTFTMIMFGIGTALPLLALGMLSREALMRWRGRILSAESGAKAILGILLIVTGTLILTGIDKILETELVRISPLWLTELTTSF